MMSSLGAPVRLALDFDLLLGVSPSSDKTLASEVIAGEAKRSESMEGLTASSVCVMKTSIALTWT
jgi:hypothetical protein